MKNKLRELSVESYSWSALKIEKVALSKKKVETLENKDVFIFCSKNSVENFSSYLDFIKDKKIYAIGETTKNKLQNFDIENIITPKVQTSEGLISLKSLSNIKGKKIALISGEGGRKLIEETLQQKGGIVEKISTYRRTKNTTSPKIISEISKFKPNLVVVTSVDVLTSFCQSFKNSLKFIDVIVVCASKRILMEAKKYQFMEYILSEGASNTKIIAVLKKSIF